MSTDCPLSPPCGYTLTAHDHTPEDTMPNPTTPVQPLDVWPDDDGRWHVRMPRRVGARKGARAAILHELEIRGDLLDRDPAGLYVDLADEQPRDGQTMIYRECWEG